MIPPRRLFPWQRTESFQPVGHQIQVQQEMDEGLHFGAPFFSAPLRFKNRLNFPVDNPCEPVLIFSANEK